MRSRSSRSASAVSGVCRSGRQHAVDPLREDLAVDEAEQRRAVEEHVVVLGLLDLVEEAVQGIAREQLGGVGRRPPDWCAGGSDLTARVQR